MSSEDWTMPRTKRNLMFKAYFEQLRGDPPTYEQAVLKLDPIDYDPMDKLIVRTHEYERYELLAIAFGVSPRELEESKKRLGYK